MDKIILSFHDSCLYESDVDILRSETSWLNDRIITFYFEYLQHEIYESKDILLIGEFLFWFKILITDLSHQTGSEVTQAIKMMQDPDSINSIFLEPLDIASRQFLIFVINDNEKNAAGGSHWSLLVYSKKDHKFFHFDSATSSNYGACSALVKIIKSCLKLPKEEKCEQVECLQQSNSYDCGIFVLCHVDLVCKTIMKAGSLSGIQKLSCKAVAKKRTDLLEVITNLARKV
jgi:sentrin-specific protease 8